jgi:aspartate aminotransferase-like enzyme/GNAT superfamily N-acetyltransferase
MVERVTSTSGLTSNEGSIPLAPFKIGKLHFRQAVHASEFGQIHRLHFRTFTQELGQYSGDGSGSHVDKFHHKNIYFICQTEGQLVGMVSVHHQAPFSFVSRLPEGTQLADLSNKPLEVRLLAVDPDWRHQRVAGGLMLAIYRWAATNDFPDLFISALEEQIPLYQRIGFRPLGDPVSQGQVHFTPMMLRLKDAPDRPRNTVVSLASPAPKPRQTGLDTISFLPGPPQMSAEVLQAALGKPVYHRSQQFVETFEQVRSQLSDLLNGHRVALFNSSGTFANDVVAAHLYAQHQQEPGMILVNGEFSRRLTVQAQAAGLTFETLDRAWGTAWDLKQIRQKFQQQPPRWLWAVQLETSTGVQNPAAELAQLCTEFSISLALDSVSALGCLPVPAQVDYCSGVAGKCLGGLAGLSLIGVHPDRVAALPRLGLPNSMSLHQALQHTGPVHTFASAPLFALQQALQPMSDPEQRLQTYARQAELGRHLRAGLRKLGITPLAEEEVSAPTITTFASPQSVKASQFLHLAQKWGFTLAGASKYLQTRGLIQVATLGAISHDQVDDFLAHLQSWLTAPRSNHSAPLESRSTQPD